jgi:hypothetical protein
MEHSAACADEGKINPAITDSANKIFLNIGSPTKVTIFIIY